MGTVLIENKSRTGIRPLQAQICDTFLCRLRGLTFRHSFPSGEGLLLVERYDSRLNAAIHMLAVFIDLAVVWVNGAGEVVDVRLARRWRLAYVPRRPARYILEMAVDRLDDFCIGDHIEFTLNG
jgi:uncharacterized membrane protein (UPF0127 family)